MCCWSRLGHSLHRSMGLTRAADSHITVSVSDRCALLTPGAWRFASACFGPATRLAAPGASSRGPDGVVRQTCHKSPRPFFLDARPGASPGHDIFDGGKAMTRFTMVVAAGIVLGAGALIAAQHDEKHQGVRTLAVRDIA